MKADIANSKRIDFVSDEERSQNQETGTNSSNQWRQKLGYCSLFAALPGLLTSQMTEVPLGNPSEPQTTVSIPERRSKSPSVRVSTPAFMRLQSKFLLPHQRSNLNMLATLAGNDNCPGLPIPGGNYTVASPYIDSGDTTGANDTVSRAYYVYYVFYNYDAFGPDHIYSFTLTARGQNPKIEVTTTSSTYKPMVYVLTEFGPGGCPSGTGNHAMNELVVSDSRSNVASLGNGAINFLPLNVPLYLFVDSPTNGANGSGPYTLRMQDVTVAPALCPDPFVCPDIFVRQHYLDFLNREPDVNGFSFWINQLTSCGTDDACLENKRIHVSAAFFLSIEFQQSGYLVYRMYKAAYGDIPGAPVPLRRDEFLPDTQRVGSNVVVGTFNWQQQLELNKNVFADDFVRRSRFTNAFPSGMSPEAFIDTLNSNSGGALSPDQRNQLVDQLRSGSTNRAQVLRAVAEDPDFVRSEFNKAFVLMQYFGYLQRNPNDSPDGDFSGFNFWLEKLDRFNGNFVSAEMVKAFINSSEYRRRFGL